eukprot:TRINITY_DN4478_c0_g1_i1.p1 TRINITY_DN4478_c0_g1~~TRINITY_DN4478_c0_g1_i1.p1  ORF type:complete len:152 (-),score=7.30 TRINITY_DN4478_c0_g1_i1:48-503(-)
MRVLQTGICFIVIIFLFSISGYGNVSAFGFVESSSPSFRADLSWRTYCSQRPSSVERNLRNLWFEDLLQLATNLIVDSCDTRNRQPVLSDFRTPRKVVSESLDRIPGAAHTSSYSGDYKSVEPPLLERTVIGSVVDVDLHNFSDQAMACCR